MKSFNLRYNVKSGSLLSDSDKLSKFAIFLLFSAISYQAFFCFVNTNVVSISSGYLMLTEILLIGIVAYNFLKGPISLPMISLLILVFANTFLLVIFQQYFDPKIIRNLMSPVLLIWLGTQYNQKISTDTLVKWFSLVVILVGIFEFVLPEIYQMIFNVINYHIAIGRSTEAALKYLEGSFSLNGTRWAGRNLLPFLGDHRASSIFLETVSMGNFSVLMACWGLSKSTFKKSIFFIISAIILAVLADSRFSSTLILVLLILRLSLSVRLLEIIAYLSPLLVILLCFYFNTGTPYYEDDFKGRLGSTGYFLFNFTPAEYWGLYNKHYHAFYDQGYAYLFHFSGVFLSIVMWISFCRLKVVDMQGRLFKSLIAILIAANLAISGDSVFAFKWVAVMWFLLGTELKTTKEKNNGITSYEN